MPPAMKIKEEGGDDAKEIDIDNLFGSGDDGSGAAGLELNAVVGITPITTEQKPPALLRGGMNKKKLVQKSIRWNTQLSTTTAFAAEDDNADEGPSPQEQSSKSNDVSTISKGTDSDSEPSSTTSGIKKTVASQTSQVFFMIGCQRSGSNWLRTMLSEREDLIAPHPPHIMRDFVTRLDKYGDLSVQENLKILVDHVCAFVERNQVQWLDMHCRPMEFKRQVILMEVMITMECFYFKEKYEAVMRGEEAPDKIEDSRYYLLAIFDVLMDTLTKANGKKIWMCKSMGMSQFHDLLLSFYGKERLRYIYLVRDPRDVCLSFMNTPVGDCHPYAITKKWAKLQKHAGHILQVAPDLIHQVCYEEVLGDKKKEVAKIVEFMGARDVCRTMRRGSIIAIKNEADVVSGAKKGRETAAAAKLSYQFKNLVRGDSFIAGQFKKWAKEMEDEDILLVESVAFSDMEWLGYEPHLIKTEEDRIDFTEELCEKYVSENKRLVDKMNADLAIKNPDDLERRMIQASVLEKTISEHYDEEFVKSFGIDVDDALDCMDKPQDDKGFLVNSATDRFDFQHWPLNASMVGFQPGGEVKERFEVHEAQKLKLKGGISITFAAASQAGYYPNERDKANQDAFIAGATVLETKRKSLLKKDRESGILFAVFDGHGPNGHECALQAKKNVEKLFIGDMKDDPTVREPLDATDHISSSMHNAYRRTSDLLTSGKMGIDAAHSGTTATALYITKDLLHTANVGDSRILLIEHDNQGKTSVKALTVDHSPDREDEIKRIEASGGVIMSSSQYDNNDPTLTSFEQMRIWSKAGKWPGTAFTRSIGDAVAKDLGVCADPECASFPIPTSDATFVLGSDGIFDFIPEEEIGAIVKKYECPTDACRELVGKAWNRWCDSEERTDDITVIIGHVKHSNRSVLGKLR